MLISVLSHKSLFAGKGHMNRQKSPFTNTCQRKETTRKLQHSHHHSSHLDINSTIHCGIHQESHTTVACVPCTSPESYLAKGGDAFLQLWAQTMRKMALYQSLKIHIALPSYSLTLCTSISLCSLLVILAHPHICLPHATQTAFRGSCLFSDPIHSSSWSRISIKINMQKAINLPLNQESNALG